MSELILTAELGERARSNNELQFKSFSFEEMVDFVGETSPEVQQRKEELMASARSLLDQYGVSDSFFDADDNNIGLLLASGLDSEAAATAGKSVTKQQSDHIIAESFARTLFGRYSETYPWEEVREASGLAEEDNLALHLKYTNADLSARLHTWFQTSDDLQDVREALGIEEKMEDFNVLVLGIGQSLHTKYLGGAVNSPEGIDEYIANIHAKGEVFMREKLADPEDNIPYAYASTLLGQRYVFIMEPTARILLEPESVGYKDDGTNLDKILKLMKHELTHTQGNIGLKDNSPEQGSSCIGRLLEEYRAEVFSDFGFEVKYRDVYSTIYGVELFGNVDIAAIMRSLPPGKGIDKVAVYSALIQDLGLNTTAKLAGLLPENYIKFQSPKSSRTLYEALDKGYLKNAIVEDMTDEDLKNFLERRDGFTDEAKAGFKDRLNAIRRSARA